MSTNKPLLFCFDFDLTLVDGHFHNDLSSRGFIPGNVSDAEIQSLFNVYGILNQKELLETFNLILNNNHHIAITTWSEYPEVIVPTLEKMGLTEAQIQKIHIESGLPQNSQLRKSGHIAKAKAHFKVEKNENVILIDDDKKNIEKAISEGQTGILVESAKTSTEYLQKVKAIVLAREPVSKSIDQNEKLLKQIKNAAKSVLFASIPTLILWQLSLLALMPVLVIGISLAVTLFVFSEYLRTKVDAIKTTLATMPNQDKQQWLQENGTAYELGYNSKAWLPYIKSYAQSTSYLKPCAYQLGLKDALEGKSQRKLIV